jgi:HEXXH motif-containing protein
MTNLPVHRIPQAMFADLAEGGGGPEAARCLVAAQHSKHALLVRQVVESACAVGHEQAAETLRSYDLLATIQEASQEAVDTVLHHPPVGSWARRTIRLLSDIGGRDRAVPAQLAGLAAAAAVRAGATCSIEVPVIAGTVMLPSLGLVSVPSSARAGRVSVEIGAGQAEVTSGRWSVRINGQASDNGTGWQRLRFLSALADDRALRILIEDLDAHRMPESANLAGRLSATEVGHWQSVLSSAWDLLTESHPQVAEDVVVIVRAFTPLRSPVGGQVSATSRETFGTIALSEPRDPCSLAVTMAHEVQHAKLSALLDMAPMTLPDDGSRYYAPWRDDPRPALGLLQGAYAFLGVTAFWRRQQVVEAGTAANQAHAEFARWRGAVQLVVDTLAASGRLTAAGESFVAGMGRTLRSWACDHVPGDAAAAAARDAADHRSRWDRRHRGAAPGSCAGPR